MNDNINSIANRIYGVLVTSGMSPSQATSVLSRLKPPLQADINALYAVWKKTAADAQAAAVAAARAEEIAKAEATLRQVTAQLSSQLAQSATLARATTRMLISGTEIPAAPVTYSATTPADQTATDLLIATVIASARTQIGNYVAAGPY